MSEDNREQILKIFFPYAALKRDAAISAKTRFVHYTTADAAMKILRSKDFFMREPSCMNDVSEVHHGMRCILTMYNDLKNPVGLKFKAALNGIFPNFAKDIEDYFNGWKPHIEAETYLTCFSEHLDSEDDYGRLSMWRAYSGVTGVALVLNSATFFLGNDNINIYASPVDYLNEQQFTKEFDKVADNIISKTAYLKKLPKPEVTFYVFQMLRFNALCTKHPAFKEEKEWRLIHNPTMEQSPVARKSIESINGLPQTIYRIHLEDVPKERIHGISIPSLLNRIIIGPSQFPTATYKAFVELLTELGIKNPSEMIAVSAIPLRT